MLQKHALFVTSLAAAGALAASSLTAGPVRLDLFHGLDGRALRLDGRVVARQSASVGEPALSDDSKVLRLVKGRVETALTPGIWMLVPEIKGFWGPPRHVVVEARAATASLYLWPLRRISLALQPPADAKGVVDVTVLFRAPKRRNPGDASSRVPETKL